MEKTDNIAGTVSQRSGYTLKWFFFQVFYTVVIGSFLSLLALGINSIASDRVAGKLLLSKYAPMIGESIAYCFVIILVTVLTLMLVQVKFNKNVNLVQYVLIECALTLFYLLLLSFTEIMGFVPAYIAVTIMTVGLITAFMYGITEIRKVSVITASALVVEYGLVLLLVSIGSAALLVGSISLFILLSVAMYFSVKLKIKDSEIFFK